jgi:cytoskeleton protein RodZ
MQNIGERLEEARKKRGISLREAAEATKIRADFLQNFENNQYDIGVPDLYVRGFLRSYANFLKLSPDKIVSDYVSISGGAPTPGREKAKELFGRIELGTPIDEPLAVSTPSSAAPSNPTGQGAASIPITEVLRQNRLKLAVIGGAVIAVIVLVALLVRLLSGGAERPSAPSDPAAGRIENRSGTLQQLTLIAKDTVDVEVFSKGDGSVVYRGTLRRGTRQPLQITGQVRIVTQTGANLEVESGGTVYRMPADGYANALFPPF